MKKFYSLIIALFVALTMNAGEVTELQALQKAQQFMKGKKFKQTNLRRATSTAGNAYYVFNAENNGGFVVVAGDDRMPDILGYSEKGNFNTTKIPTNVKWLMDYYAKIAQSLKGNKEAKATRRAATERAEVLPLMKTTWDQGNPYNLHCPEIESNNALTGCVATAMAQVINFLQWPLVEVKAVAGYTTLQDKIDVEALPARKFNWYNMTDDEIAWLMRYCGQSVMMEYKSDESAAAPVNIPYALSSIFGLSKNVKLVVHKDIADAEWEEMMYNEVNLGRPIIYSGFQGTSGHSFVLHGYKEGKFMVNWGWGGTFDGYFALTNLAPNEFQNWSDDQNAVIGIQPSAGNDLAEGEEGSVRTINVETAGTLSNYISAEEKYKITSLTLTGNLNGTDFRLIREMAGNNYKGEPTEGKLCRLDISGAKIVAGGETYVDTETIKWTQKENVFSVTTSSHSTTNNVIGAFLLAGCVKLNYLWLPETATEIETRAFDGTDLKQINIPKSVTKIDIFAFNNNFRELSEITIEEGNPVYTTMGNYNTIIEKQTQKLLVAFCSTSIVPEGVKVIGSHAFDGCGTNSGLWPQLPESLTTIEADGMSQTNPKSIYIPKNVTSLGKQALPNCADVINVDKGNKIFDSRNGCNALIETATNTLLLGSRNAEIPDGVEILADGTFNGIYVGGIIEIPASVKTISETAFGYGYDFKVVKVRGSNPIEIPENTFMNIPSSARLVVPDGTKEKYNSAVGWNKFSNIIEESSFSSGKVLHVATAGSLSSLISEEEKYNIESLMLTGYLNATDFAVIRDMSMPQVDKNGILKKLDISNARLVTGGESSTGTYGTIPAFPEDDFLGDFALFSADNLEEVKLPQTLKGIGDQVFEGCKRLKSIVIPKSVVKIGIAPFYLCYKLASISVEEGNPIFDSRDNCNAIIETATNTIRCASHTTVIPESVIAIGNSAYSGRLGLTSIEIPNWITSLESSAFYSCEALTSVTIPKGITTWDGYVFSGCTNLGAIKVSSENPIFDSRDNCNAVIETASNTLLQGIYTTKIPNSVTKIASGAFYMVEKLTSIEIPSSITEIGGKAFLYCHQLTKVVCHIKKPLTISTDVFLNDNLSTAVLYVPYGTKKAYASSPGWDVFGEIIEMEPDDSYLHNAASIAKADFGKHYAALNGEVDVPITISGEGIEPIISIDYTINNGTEQHLEVEPISYMMTSEVLIPYKADATAGEVAKTLKITKVNGVANEWAENITATGSLVTVTKKPKIIPVVEENTGTWCGWCSRGLVALKLLNKQFGNDIITIAIHDGGDNEPMMLPEYRATYWSYPGCQINRGEYFDPYFGAGNAAYGIKKEVEAVQRNYALGSIDMTAEWTDDSKTSINVKTTTTFVEDVTESPYQIGYVLLEDGVTGTGDAWAQSNYYAGNNTTDENLKELTTKPAKITDMKYDHVPVAAWEPMTGVAGTIPTTITHDVPMEYTFKADISSNTRIQNKNKLTVVALLLHKETGKIINAAKFKFEVAPGITFTAKSYTRKYGEENPKFEFIVDNDATYEGAPVLSTEATVKSPVGKYDITIAQGTLVKCVPIFKNGTLTIEKAPLKITAKSYTIKQGEDLPSFEATYEGFKNNESSAVLTKQPAITTTATSASAPGEYEITVSGAETQNYEISYVAGKLTIEAVEIVPINETEEKTFSQQVDETTDLQNTVIDNTYFNMDTANGDGYDATEQALVLNSTTSSTQMSAVQGAQVGDAAVRENFSGIIFEIPAGQGVITVDAKTIGTHVLNVQIGNGAPTQVKKSERGTAEVEYNVSAPTYVYLYASKESGASARLYRGPSAGANSVLLYGYKVQVGGTGIEELKNGKMEELKYYDLNGRKVKTPRKGVYIINGKKVVVK